MPKVTVQIQGLDQLKANMKAIGTTAAGKVIRKALRDGAKLVASEAKRRAPVKSGQTRESIKVRSGNIRKAGRYRMAVITGKGDYKGDEYYASFVEYGHRIGKRSRGVARLQEQKSKTRDKAKKAFLNAKLSLADPRRLVRARPFMRPAFDNVKDIVTAQITGDIVTGIERAAEAMPK